MGVISMLKGRVVFGVHPDCIRLNARLSRLARCIGSPACLLLLAFCSGMVHAQSTNSNAVTDEGSVLSQFKSPDLSAIQGLAERVSVDIDAFNIIGTNPISSTKSYAIVNQYLGADRGIDDVEKAAAALENELRDLGESFYRVSLPPQELSDGVVDLQITRYRVGSTTVTGNKHYSADNILRSLPQLVAGNSPSSKAMARSLTIANQNSGKRTRLTLETGDKENEIDATLSVVDQNPLSFTAWLNNTGTQASGDYRVGASLSHRNLFGRDHSASLTFISSPEDFDEVQQLALSYKVPVYTWGGSFNFFAVQSDIDSGTVEDVFEVAGSGDVYGLGYTQVLSKIKDYRHQLSAQLNDKLFDNDISFLGTQIATDVRSRPFVLAYQASWNNGEGWEIRGAATWSTNLSGGGDNTEQAYQLSRTGAERDWDKLSLDLSLQYSFGNWLWTTAVNYSETGDRLITGEQFALGGMNSIRGMDERELTWPCGHPVLPRRLGQLSFWT